MFIATTDKVQDNRQYINIYQNSKKNKTQTHNQPTYTVSVPMENTQEFLRTLEKLDTFSPEVNKTYKEKPKTIQKITIALSGALASVIGYSTVSLLSSVSLLNTKSKGLIKALTTGVAAVAGGFAGNKMFHKSASIFNKLDELGMRLEQPQTETAKQEPIQTESVQETLQETAEEETEETEEAE